MDRQNGKRKGKEWAGRSDKRADEFLACHPDSNRLSMIAALCVQHRGSFLLKGTGDALDVSYPKEEERGVGDMDW